MNILVLPDAHARDGVSNRRFTWLGKLIVDLKPDVVLCLGDFFDMPSLSSYDGSLLTGSHRPTASFEGRRYIKDLEAGIEALDRIQIELNKAARARPRRIFLHGNHEDRVNRAANNAPELQGVLSLEDMQLKHYNWEENKFLDPVEVGGFVAQHYHVSGLMGRPIGGETHARNLILKTHESCIQGHSHLWDFHQHTSPRGQRKQAFVCGWFGDPLQKESYAGPAQVMWDSSVTLLKGVVNGVAVDGFEKITVAKMQKEYA